MAICYLGLGANIDDPERQIYAALESLTLLKSTQLKNCSSLYSSRPQGPEDQPDYVNAVAKIETKLSPIELLNSTQAIEQQQGRIKLRHWGERCIDLDILLYDQLVLNTKRLTIPHPHMQQRDFVITPLLEITPDLVLPNKKRLADINPEFFGELKKLHKPRIDF